MKVSDISTEAPPYHHDGTMPRPSFGTTFTSDGALERLYDFVDSYIIDGEVIDFYMLKAQPKIIGVIKGMKPSGEDSNRHIFSLMFKTRHTLVIIPKEFNGYKILQVDKVAIDNGFEGFGTASFVYATLAKSGYIILSDTSQFTDGKMLWKKMARVAKASDYNIYILDDEYGFQLDKNKQPIKYDSSNIDDANIWSAGADVSKEHILLCMKH